MVNNKEAIKEAFNRFVTQQAREQGCHDDEIIDVIREYVSDITSNCSLI